MRALRSHKTHKHTVRHTVQSKVCPQCQRQFTTKTAAQRHFTRGSCGSRVANHGHAGALEGERLSAAAAAAQANQPVPVRPFQQRTLQSYFATHAAGLPRAHLGQPDHQSTSHTQRQCTNGRRTTIGFHRHRAHLPLLPYAMARNPETCAVRPVHSAEDTLPAVRRKAEGRAARRGWSSCAYNWKFLCAINLCVGSRNCVYWAEPMTGYVKQNWSKNSMYPTWGDKNDSQFDEDADFLKVLTFVGSWSTLSPTIMEVENHSKWKETNIGGTCSFSTSMLMGGRLFVSSRPGFQCVFHSEWRLPDFVIW